MDKILGIPIVGPRTIEATSALAAKIGRTFRFPRQAETTTSAPARGYSAAHRMRQELEQARWRVIAECERMYRHDARINAAIQRFAEDATRAEFGIVVDDGPQADAAAQIASDMIARLRLARRLDDWMRRALITGDAFIEIGVTRGGEIVEATLKPTRLMHRHVDINGRWIDPDVAYWYAPEVIYDGAMPDAEPPQSAIKFAEWQIVHARWKHDEGQRYGTPQFAPALQSWRYVRDGELNMAMRRKTRAGLIRHHSIGGPNSEANIARYMERNRDTLDEPFAAIADIFTGEDTEIRILQGDATLSEIGDVQHHLETLTAASPVPLALITGGADLNRDVLEDQRAQYDRTLESATEWLDDQIIVPLIERQWALAGINPDMYDWHVSRPPRYVLSPADVQAAAAAIASLRLANVVPPAELVELLARWLPGMDVDAAIAYAAQEPDSGRFG